MELIQENVSALAAKIGSTPEVLQKFLTDATAAAEVKPFADSLGLLQVFTPDELTQRIGNETKTAAEKATNDTKGVTWGIADKKILDETGIPKNQGEMTIDYMVRAAKEKFGTKGNESDEMKHLREDIAAKDSLLTQTNSKLSEMEVAHATERKQTQINGTLDTPINALPINTTPELLDSQREFVKYRIMLAHTADVVDGKVQFTDKATGQVVRDPKTAAPMTAAALVEQFAPKVVSLKKQSAAQGSGFDSSRTNLNDAEVSTFDYSQYATKQDFATALNKAGITSDSEQGVKLYKAFRAARTDLN